MTLHVWGTDYRRSDAEMRRLLYLEPEGRRERLQPLAALGFRDLVYVYTCNRVEFYTSAPDHFTDTRALWLRLLQHLGLPEEAFFRGYHLEGKSAIRHLLRVASSLESLVLGEPQILGQLKDAHREAPLGVQTGLDRAFNLAFETAKRVRTETAIGEKPVSVAALGLSHMLRRENEFPLTKVAVVGRSPMSRNVLQWLSKNRPGVSVVWVNRDVEKLKAHPESQGRELVSLDDFLQSPPDFSHLFTATASREPLFGHNFFSRLGERPRLLLDFAEPADIAEPCCEANVFVVRIKDLKDEAQENATARARAVEAAEKIIESSMKEFFLRQKQAPVLRDFSAIEPEVMAELERAIDDLAAELPSEFQASVREWAEKLVKKNLYQSQKHLRTILRGDPGGSVPL